eukprot:2264308-Prymnesium_polylepis.1
MTSWMASARRPACSSKGVSVHAQCAIGLQQHMDPEGSAMQGRETAGSDRPRASHAGPLSTCYSGNLSLIHI